MMQDGMAYLWKNLNKHVLKKQYLKVWKNWIKILVTGMQIKVKLFITEVIKAVSIVHEEDKDVISFRLYFVKYDHLNF